MTEDEQADREESPTAAADRRYNELLQELRVAQTGVQFLFAFLLTLTFTQRFTQITEFQRDLYIVTLLVTAAASALLIGPVSTHRILHHRGLKPRLVLLGGRMALGGLALLLVAINCAILLILDVVLDSPLAFVLTALTTAWFLVIWYVLPMTAREQPDRREHSG
jgi:Family of unknown function (DUF6328)